MIRDLVIIAVTFAVLGVASHFLTGRSSVVSFTLYLLSVLLATLAVLAASLGSAIHTA